ncbi:MAG: DNA-directed RNA polymerase subunit D [Halobacteria archaeon]|nr:DNA-directed RNA polymerase subunit D [Halobacteria archaeon]
METEYIEKSDKKARLIVRDVSPAFANGIRRAILSDVPTMSIDDVDMYENTSVMFDEIISLRLGLVPLTTDLDSYNLPDECSCEGEGCAQCEVSLTVDVEADDEDVTVYSSDLESEDPEVEPVTGGIPIIKLKPGQAFTAECKARLGKGTQHAKNQGGTAVGYRNLQRVTDDPGDEEIVRGVIEDDDGELVDMEEYGNDITEAFGDGVGVEDVSNSYVFHIETDGSHSVEEIVEYAADSLSSRADELQSSIAP